MNIQIQTAVLSATYQGVRFDLKELARRLKGARYDPDVFPGIAYRSGEPPAADFLIFGSGRINCTAKSVGDAMGAIKHITKELGVKAEPDVKVMGISASFDLGAKLDLEMIAKSVENITYEPKALPSAVFKLDEPAVAVLLFKSGNVIIAGAKSEDDIKRAAAKVAGMRLEKFKK